MIFGTSRWKELTLTDKVKELGIDPATVSKWCTNVAQPTLETLLQIAKLLEVEVQDLLVKPTQI